MPEPKIAFFDLGDTLGVPRFNPAGTLTAFEVFPFVPEVLARMKAPAPVGSGARLVVISNTPDEASVSSMSALLAAAGILAVFEPGLLLFSSVEGMDKSQSRFFSRAAERAGVPSIRCLFVGESAAERDKAKAAGMKTAFHPLHAFDVLKSM